MFDDKIKVLQDLIDHLTSAQGSGLKSSLDASKKPLDIEPINPPIEKDPGKGLKIESIEIMKPKNGVDQKADDAIQSVTGKPSMGINDPDSMPDKDGDYDKGKDEPEMSDEELEELLKKLM